MASPCCLLQFVLIGSIYQDYQDFCFLDRQVISLVKTVKSTLFCPKPPPRSLHTPLPRLLLLSTPGIFTLPSDRTCFCILLSQLFHHWKCSHSLYCSLFFVVFPLSRTSWTCDLFPRKGCFIC